MTTSSRTAAPAPAAPGRAGLPPVGLLVGALAGGGALAARPAVALAGGDGGAAAGVRLTLDATAEPLEASPEAGLVLRVALENATAGDLTDLRLRIPAPDGARVTESGPDGPDGDLGARDGGGVAWGGLTLPRGGRLGPFAARLVPAALGAGARVFREAAVRPEATWRLPAPGRAAASLPLNGLWGEAALRRTVLPDGLTVLTRERPESPTVSVRAAVRAGSRDEDDATRGGSHWLEHAHFLGTPRRPGGRPELGDEIEAVGGQTNASTGWEATDYWHLVPAEQFELALDVLADQLVHSTFPREAFDRERGVVFEELRARNDAPGTRATDEFLRQVFRVSPLRHDAGGTIESVQAIPVETILAYRARRYVTGNTAVAAAGPLRHDAAVAAIAAAFAGLPVGARSERPRVPEPPPTAPRRLAIGAGAGAAEVRLGWSAPGVLDDDYGAMALLQDVLGATGRRLTEVIRDRRALASAVGPTYFAFSDAGALMLFAATTPERVEEVVALALREVQRLREGDVTDAEVAASLRAIAGRRALAEELSQAQTGRAVGEVAGTLQSAEEYLARLRAVRPADIQRVALRYLDPVNHTLVVVRP